MIYQGEVQIIWDGLRRRVHSSCASFELAQLSIHFHVIIYLSLRSLVQVPAVSGVVGHTDAKSRVEGTEASGGPLV